MADEREAKAVAAFRQRLNSLFDDVGDAGYAAYRSDPRWLGVQEAARDAVALMESPQNADEITVSWDVAVIWASVRE